MGGPDQGSLSGAAADQTTVVHSSENESADQNLYQFSNAIADCLDARVTTVSPAFPSHYNIYHRNILGQKKTIARTQWSYEANRGKGAALLLQEGIKSDGPIEEIVRKFENKLGYVSVVSEIENALRPDSDRLDKKICISGFGPKIP